VRLLWEGASRRTSYSGVIWDGELCVVDGEGTLGEVERLRFDSPRSFVRREAANRVAWHSVTCGYRSGIVIELPAEGEMTFSCTMRTSLITRPFFGGHGESGEARMAYSPAEAVAFRFGLRDLAEGPVRLGLGALDRWITASLAPEAGNATEARFTFTDHDPRPGVNPYWVRVIQEDQEMAWTSPVFVDFVGPTA
jgi:hypothetical protein